MNTRDVIINEMKELELKLGKKISAYMFCFLNNITYDMHSHPERYSIKSLKELKKRDLQKVFIPIIKNISDNH